jgi:hypothetical protein
MNEAHGAIPERFASAEEGLRFFDRLQPVKGEEMTGLWRGRGVGSGHPLDGVLENLGWFGKRFHQDMRADALLFEVRGRHLAALDPARIPLGLALRFSRFGRSRVARNWFWHLQKALRAEGSVASLKPLAFRGATSMAMAYDRQPITDHFRKADADHLLGVMAISGEKNYYFFTLERVV